jgi:hypothetical protein
LKTHRLATCQCQLGQEPLLSSRLAHSSNCTPTNCNYRSESRLVQGAFGVLLAFLPSRALLVANRKGRRTPIIQWTRSQPSLPDIVNPYNVRSSLGKLTVISNLFFSAFMTKYVSATCSHVSTQYPRPHLLATVAPGTLPPKPMRQMAITSLFPR